MSSETYYKVGGSLEYQHPTYVVRQADRELYDGLQNGEFCYVLNSRQMGKSSLRVQLTKQLKEQGIKCASIDMTRIGSHVTPSEWYGGVVSELLRGFGLLRKVDFSNWWRERELLSPVQRLSEFIEDVLLEEFSEKIVIFIDEIDSILQVKFRDDFFAFIRACYNQRAENQAYRRLTFALLGVATPSDLIADKNLSTPFNIGRAIELTGFELQETQPLTQGLQGISLPEAVMSEVLAWTGGQPFLTQKVCKLISTCFEPMPVGGEAKWVEQLVRSRIIENWETQDEPEHLRTIRDRLLWSDRKHKLLQLYQQILQTSPLPRGDGGVTAKDTPEHLELRLSGLVVKQQGKLKVYNRIYASIFHKNWLKNALSEVDNEVAQTPEDFNAEIQTIEQAATKALQMFKYGQIKALLKAMQAGQELQTLVKDGCPLQDYPTITPIYALQQLLNNIREHNQFKSDQGAVYDVCFSPDGQCLATAGDDGTVRLWNLFGQQIAEWQAHQGIVYAVYFSPDGQLIATAGRDGKARLWNLSGQQINEFDGHQRWVSSVSFSPDGKLIATAGGDCKAKLWNLSGQKIAQFDGHSKEVWSTSFSPNGQYIATAGLEGKARLWHLSGLQLILFNGHQGKVWSVSFSPDGRHLASAGDDSTARLWDLSGKQLAQFNGHQNGVKVVVFSPNGQYLVTGGYDGTARLWDLSGQQLAQLNGHIGAVLGLSFSRDGQYLATAGVDGTTRIWDLSDKHLAQLNGHQGQVWSVVFSRDGKLIATAGRDGTARLWNLLGQQLAQMDGHQGSVWNVSFSPDGLYIVTTSSDSTARLWNLSGQPLAKLSGHQGWVTRIIFSPDGQRFATVGRDGTARVWDLSGQLVNKVTPYQGWVWSVNFSEDGQLIATVGLDATAPLLDSSGRLILQLKDYQSAAHHSFSPDGQYLVTASSEDGTARLWNVFGRQLAQLDGEQDWVLCVSFSPDGQLVATAGENGSVCLWDLLGRQVSRFEGNQGAIYGMSFSPDGRCLATAGKDGTVKLWRVEGLDELLARGCNWLNDYFVSHPEELEKLQVCQNSFDYIADTKSLVTNDVEEKAISLPVIPDCLNSESGIDYTELRNFLAGGQWKEADQETMAIMLRIGDREAKDWLREEDIENFPGTDLHTIDQLWVKYSKGRFGFSIQKEIWESFGGTKNAHYKIYCNTCDQIGWRDLNGSWLYYSDLNFNITAPIGHLPGVLKDWLWYSYRASRLSLRDESADSADDLVWWNIISSFTSKLAKCYRQPTASVTTVSNQSKEGFLGEFLVRDKLVKIYQGDITNLVTDVIVSSDDTCLKRAGGVAWRIHEVGGNEIYQETRNLIPLPLGNIAVTQAGKLRAKTVFHGIVIDWRNEILPSEGIIVQVIHKCLEKADEGGFKRIAFPLLGAGASGFSPKVCWEITLRKIVRELSTKPYNLSEVIIVLFEPRMIEEVNVKGCLEKIEKLGWASIL